MGDDYLPGVWHWLTTKLFGRRNDELFKFEQQLEEWKYTVNGAEILRELTLRFRDKGAPTENSQTSFDQAVMEEAFSKWINRGSDLVLPKLWTFNSTKSFLASQVPNHFDVSMSDLTRIIHRSLWFWAQYPIVTKPRHGLDKDDLLRAVSFIADIDKLIFPSASQEAGVQETADTCKDHDMFRSLAELGPEHQHSNQPNSDVVRALRMLQPKPDAREHDDPASWSLSPKTFAKLATNMSDGKHPLRCYRVRRTELTCLLLFLMKALETYAPTKNVFLMMRDLRLLHYRIRDTEKDFITWTDGEEQLTYGIGAIRVAMKLLFRPLYRKNVPTRDHVFDGVYPRGFKPVSPSDSPDTQQKLSISSSTTRNTEFA